MTGATPEYQYHMKDHLGNVRLTFTTKDETESATATLETANLSNEQSKFLRMENARMYIQALLSVPQSDISEIEVFDFGAIQEK